MLFLEDKWVFFENEFSVFILMKWDMISYGNSFQASDFASNNSNYYLDYKSLQSYIISKHDKLLHISSHCELAIVLE